MGKAIFFGTPADGHVNPSLGLVRELARRGEEILYYSFPGYERRIAAAGAEYRATPVARPDVGAKRLSFLYRSIVEVTAEGLERCVGIVEDERPAYVIHDSLAPWGKFAAQLAGVPSVASVPSFVYRSRPFRLKDLLSFLRRVRLSDVRALRASSPGLATLRERFGVARGLRFPELIVSLSPLNIVYTIAGLQPSGGELDPARYRFVGPSISAGEREAGEPDYAALPRPMIYVSFGTIMHEQPRLYQALVPRLEGLGASVVMSVGGRVDPASLGPVPSNFVIRARVSQLEVLRSADVFVTHGGMNSFHEALSLGVPMVSIPFHEEQRTVARQCAAHGCGVHVARPEAGAIADAVREVLARPSYRERCARLSRELRESGGAAAAADSILAYAGAERRGRGGTDARVGP